jgi:DNA-binding phage protein
MRVFEAATHRYGNAAGFVAELSEDMARHGITQAKLARRAGINAQMLNRYMRGAATPSLWTMVYLDEAMHELVDECES